MSQSEPQCDLWLSRFREHLRAECYSWDVVRTYPAAARRFLLDLEQRGQTVESVSPADVESYLSTLGAEHLRPPALGERLAMLGVEPAARDALEVLVQNGGECPGPVLGHHIVEACVANERRVSVDGVKTIASL